MWVSRDLIVSSVILSASCEINGAGKSASSTSMSMLMVELFF